MLCVDCLDDWQHHLIGPDTQEIRNARYIYRGDGVCGIHLNIRKGLPPDREFRFPQDKPLPGLRQDAEGRKTLA